MPALLKIEHCPLGLEHPYQPEPTERRPRQPLAGQPVTLGLAAWPAGSAERVWAHWSAGGAAGEAQGTVAGEEGGRSLWQVDLPAFAALQRVEYRLFATGGGSELQTGDFTFTPAAWTVPGKLAAARLEAGQVLLEFSGGDLTTRLALHFPRPNRLHLRWQAGPACSEDGAGRPLRAAGELGAGAAFQVTGQDEDHLALQSGSLAVELDLRPFRLVVRRQADGQAIFEQDSAPAWLVGEGSRPLLLGQEFPCPPEEGFYGFGERFNALNQRGNRLEVCVFEQYKNQGLKTYIPVPFCFSSRGWGLYLNTARRVDYDLGVTRPDRWSFTADPGPEMALEYDLMAGRPAELLAAFSEISGRPALPPAWVFGPWMSSNEWNSQAEVEHQVALTRQHGIPASVLVIEAWADEATFYIWNGARYNLKPGGAAFRYSDFTFPPDGLWTDPKAMIEALHQDGIHLVLWQIPVMKKMEPGVPSSGDAANLFEGPPGPAEILRVEQRDLDEAYMLEQGYHLKYASGEPYRVRPFWFHDSLLPDFSNPQAAEWWLNKRAYLLDELGVDGFKTDGGEHLWGQDVRFFDGRGGDEGINLYPNLYEEAYYRFGNRKRPGQYVNFSRAGFTGAQAFPCHWAGDENSSWDTLRASLLAGLNAGLSGIPFWGWDIAGFSGEVPGAELYLRSAAMAAFCPIMQFHSEFNNHRQPNRDRTPWNIAERSGRPEVISIYRQYARLRMGLLPYIEAEARHSAESGEPLMRPLFLDWPDDPHCWQISDQYCFGRALLVAPVVQPGALERRLYLPEGNWLDFWDGSLQAGGRWVTVPAPLERIPVFRRLGQDWPVLED